MGSVTSGYIASEYRTSPICDPEDVDNLVKKSGVLSRLSEEVPFLTTGQLDQSRQAWTATPRAPLSASGRTRRTILSQQEFHRVQHRGTRLLTKPAEGGLFTSTVVPRLGKSMWRMYLEAYGGSRFPPPYESSKSRLP